ncbi:MAG: ABC transporter ATP-binding protein, partial [Deltaproteobacteria bacterium]|nr:ABC transporter ATP-binding protein [Deltaproteobacteria bacterium]
MSSAPLLALRDVSFTYRGAAQPALHEVSLTLRHGEFVVVMGATGAGKSTLARCVNRSIPQFHRGELAGAVTVAGAALEGRTVSDLAGTIGLVSQDFEAQLFATNVRQEVAFGMEQLGVPAEAMQRRLDEALGLVGLDGFAARDPITLSGGEKQRLAIAALLALRPALLVLDEPTTDLDPAGKEEIFAVLAALRRRGASVLLIEHETAAAVHADRVVLMAGGRIVVDAPPAEVLPDVARLERLGVRPLDLDRVVAAFGWRERPASVEAAAARLQRRAPAEVPAAPAAA